VRGEVSEEAGHYSHPDNHTNRLSPTWHWKRERIMSIWPFKTNFSLIAENTTKFYMELTTRYKERFPDDASLLATTGILDARNYIFSSSPQIDITDIIELARRCTAKGEDYMPIRKLIRSSEMIQKYRRRKLSAYDVLASCDDSEEPPKCTDEVFDFVFGLELLLFKADNTNFSPTDIEEACRSKQKAIEKAITGTMKKYNVGKGIFAQATTTFMEDVSLESVRNSLGILP